MKKAIISITLSIMFLFNITAFAAEETTVDPGITPDSILYPVDKLVENAQLLITTDPVKEANLLLDIADERLAEAQVMTDENKIEDANEAVDGYIEAIGDAQENVLEVIADQNTSTEVKDELTQDLANATEVDSSIEDNLGDEQQAELDDTIQDIVISANVVKDIDTEVVKTLRQEGLGFGQIAQVSLLAEKTGKSMDEISLLFKDGKGFGTAAKELGLSPSEVKKQYREKTGEAVEESPAQEVPASANSEDVPVAVDNQDASKAQTLTATPQVKVQTTTKSQSIETKTLTETKNDSSSIKSSNEAQMDNSSDKGKSEKAEEAKSQVKDNKGKGKSN